MTATRFRQRKLSTKASLQVIDDTQIDATDDDTRHIAAIESGVERTEEIEHHLQAAISAANAAALGTKVKAAFIPTPDASKVIDNYDALYRKTYSHPHSYVRFSSTVEDCSGHLYCIDEEDDEYLAQYNTKRSQGTQCTEDKFEEVMDEYESLTALKQPFLALNEDENLPIHLMSYEEMEEAAFEDDYKLSDNVFAKELFPYWETKRLKRKGRPLMPSLKFEQGQIDKDDGDPYVCFRRREHRPARKTRRTDAQSIDKLKRLRLDMERVRSLSRCIVQREDVKKDNQLLEYKVFLTRGKLKKVKRDFNIVDNDDDLVNKPRKRAVEQPTPVQKAPTRYDGKPPEADLVQLEDLHKLRRETMDRAIQEARKKRQYSYAGWCDRTVEAFQRTPPYTPPNDHSFSFRKVRTYYARQLLSPPPSASPSLSPSSPNPRSNGVLQPRITFQTAPPSPQKRKLEDEESEVLRFRIRTGRNGRVMIDRRGMTLSNKDRESVEDRTRDRYKFDHDDSDEELEEFPMVKKYDRDQSLQFSANLFLQQVMPQSQQLIQRRHDNLANGNSPTTGNLTPNTPSVPHATSPMKPPA